MEKLLIAAVADSDVSVRKSVFSSLHENVSFDEFLAQADSLRSFFVALNDEVVLFNLFCSLVHCKSVLGSNLLRYFPLITFCIYTFCISS